MCAWSLELSERRWDLSCFLKEEWPSAKRTILQVQRTGQVQRTLHSILRKEYHNSLEVGMQETCSGVRKACRVQLRTGEEGSMGLCTRAKGDVLSSRRKPSRWVLLWGERRLEWQHFSGGSCCLGSWTYHEYHLSCRTWTELSSPEVLADSTFGLQVIASSPCNGGRIPRTEVRRHEP